MESTLYYNFQTLNFSRKCEIFSFEGTHVSVEKFKTEIKKSKNLFQCDLLVKDPITKKEYKNDDLIPAKSSVMLIRIPLAEAHRKKRSREETRLELNERANKLPRIDPKEIDLTKLKCSEEEVIDLMCQISSHMYSPAYYQNVYCKRSPPKTYQCYKCGKPGHWRYQCTNQQIKRTTGIPKTLIKNYQATP